MSQTTSSQVDNGTGGSSNGAADKPSIVELKNGKVVFKQKSISFEKLSETLQEIVKFREMLEEHIKWQCPPLSSIPDEHRPVIAKLVHESDKTLGALTKQVRQALLPAQDEDADTNSNLPSSVALPVEVVEAAIRANATRNNYGIDAPLGTKVPAALCVWRWEIKPEYMDWLPKATREKAKARLAERAQAKHDLSNLFNSLSKEDQDIILDPKRSNRKDVKFKTHNSILPANTSGDESKDSTPKKQGKAKSQDPADDLEQTTESSNTKSIITRKKSNDPEKAAKEKEKQEKRAQKTEKERKAQEAQSKSRSLLANFFGKKAINASQSTSTDSVSSKPSTSQSDFDKTFKPFMLKKGAELAPINFFTTTKEKRGKTGQSQRDAIIIDSEEGTKQIPEETTEQSRVDVSQMDDRARLNSILSSLPPGISRNRPSVHVTTRVLMSQLAEAEIAGDVSAVRCLLSTLLDRSTLPAKVFIFTEDARPGYFGTWTRSSHVITPRQPFKCDVIERDYGYDSGEEWEDEPEGGADDVVNDEDDEDMASEESDSDLDNWLVDDDEVLEDLATSPMSPMSSPIPMPPPPPKRKVDDIAAEQDRKLGKKRKVVVPLVPFAKGPCWETKIGHCEYDAFKPYRIQLFNDTPFPINPFTFEATMAPNTQKEFSKSTNNTVPERTTSTAHDDVPTPKRVPAPTPKTSFPSAYLPLLLDKITTLATGNVTFIVETVHQELRTHNVKKNAIEAKVKEVGEKSKEKKVWVVREEYRATCAVSR